MSPTPVCAVAALASVCLLACTSTSPQPSKEGAASAEPAPRETRAASAEPAPSAASARPAAGDTPTALALAGFERCIATDQSAAAVFSCGCRGDLVRSEAAGPADADQHCREYADRLVAQLEGGEAELKTQVTPAAAADVSIPTHVLAAAWVACRFGDGQSDSPDRRAQCLCVAEHVAAQGQGKSFASDAELAESLRRFGAEAANGPCRGAGERSSQSR